MEQRMRARCGALTKQPPSTAASGTGDPQEWGGAAASRCSTENKNEEWPPGLRFQKQGEQGAWEEGVPQAGEETQGLSRAHTSGTPGSGSLFQVGGAVDLAPSALRTMGSRN